MPARKTIGKCAASLITLLITVITLSSCNATPEKAIVQNKNAANLINLIKNSKPGASGIQALAGKHVKETYRNQTGTVAIELDADVVLPKADKIPAAEAVPKMLGQQDLKKLLSALVGDEPLYEYDDRLTKDEIKQIILDMKKSKAEDQNKTAPPASSNGAVPMPADQVDSIIAEYEAMLADAPDEITYQPADYTKLGDGKDYYFMAQTKPVNGVYNYISIEYSPISGTVIEFYNPYFVGHRYERFNDKQPDGLKLSAEEAVAQAEKLLSDIGAEGMKVASVLAVEADASITSGNSNISVKLPCYQIAFNRAVSSVPSNYEYRYWTEEKIADDQFNMGYYESAIVNINDGGLISFEWYCPLEIKQELSGDVGLLDFNRVLEIAKEQINVENAFIENSQVDSMAATIDTIQLGMMQIRVKDKPGSFLLVPVWDFYGKYRYHLKDKSAGGWSDVDDDGWAHVDNVAQSLLTVNAIDGTVIDRGLGY